MQNKKKSNWVLLRELAHFLNLVWTRTEWRPATRMTIQMSIRSERWLFEKGQNSRLLQAYVLINSPNKIFISTLTTGFANRKHLPLFYGYIKDSNTERLITFILLVSE